MPGPLLPFWCSVLNAVYLPCSIIGGRKDTRVGGNRNFFEKVTFKSGLIMWAAEIRRLALQVEREVPAEFCENVRDLFVVVSNRVRWF